MLYEAGVVLVPGLDFGPFTARRYIRLSYATSMEKLQEAVARLRVFFESRRKAA
jgi:aspartate/methionine/tyrosine aminotransferase